MTGYFKAVALALSLALTTVPAYAVTGPTTSTPAAVVLSSKASELLTAAKATCTAQGATEEACKAAVAAYVAQLKSEGLTGKALDDALVPMVAALTDGSSTLAPALQKVLGAAIKDLSTEFSDPRQAELVASIGQDVSDGKKVETGATETPASGA
jgi:hypothetical protein